MSKFALAHDLSTRGRWTAAGAVLVLALATIARTSITSAQAAPATSSGGAEAIVEARQKNLKALGAAYKVVRDELRESTPDTAKIKSAAQDIARAGGSIGEWFPSGSGPESGTKTDARPEVWSDAAGFAAARDAFVTEAKKWTQLSGSTDLTAWKAAADALGRTCKGCHDSYREKRE